MDNKKKALGKGLEQLFANNAINFETVENKIIEDANESDITEVNLGEIRSNPYQPRKVFDEVALNELAQSIKEFGVIQPVILKKSVKGYELIAGERRCKASKIAGKEKVPAIIKDFTDGDMMEIALLENVQREDLNPIEVANSINEIIKLRNLTQEDFAKKFGKSRSYITNLLGLLRLPDNVKDLVSDKKISMSHAKILSKIDDNEKIQDLAKKIISEDLSVHDLEKLINTQSSKVVSYKEVFEKYKLYENLVSDHLNEKVKISKNKIEIKFADEEDLLRILNIMSVKVDD